MANQNGGFAASFMALIIMIYQYFGTDLIKEENEPVLSPRHSANSFPKCWKWREMTTVIAVVS
jgi:hypothetical protein